MPGPPPTPTHLKLLRGNAGKRSIRPGPMPEIPPEVPAPPSFLLPAAKDEWWRLSGELHVFGLLSNLDVHVLVAYCQSYARWRQAEETLAVFAEKRSGNAWNPDQGCGRQRAGEPAAQGCQCCRGGYGSLRFGIWHEPGGQSSSRGRHCVAARQEQV
jgi:phage terminase small subunit